MKYDRHYCLYEYSDGEFRYIPNTTTLWKIVKLWTNQDNFFDGPKKLYIKRSLIIPNSCTEQEIQNSKENGTTMDNIAHNLCFNECVYHYLHGHYRFAIPNIMSLAVLLLQSTKGNYDKSKDNQEKLKPWIEHLCPIYALKDISSIDHERGYSMGKCEGALPIDDISKLILVRYSTMTTRTLYSAQKEFIRICRENPIYGNEFFYGQRTWKEQEIQPDGSTKEVAKTEKICLGIGYDGISLLGIENPLSLEIHDIGEIGKWLVSRDGKIFAFTLDDDRVIYIMTELASLIERTIEEYVEERVKLLDADNNPDSDSSKIPRSIHDEGVGEIPPLISVHTAPPYIWNEDTTSTSSSNSRSSSSSSSSSNYSTAAILAAAARTTHLQEVFQLTNTNNPHNNIGLDKLPSGWLELRTSENEIYYYHAERQITQWERPKPPGIVALINERLPKGWLSAIDTETGELYYYNEENNNEVQWERPEFPEENLAPNWTILKDSEGDIYYWNTITNETSWTKPRKTNPPPSAADTAFTLNSIH